MPRRRLVRSQIPKPMEENEEKTTNEEGSAPDTNETLPAEGSTTTGISPSEPDTTPSEPLSQLTTPRRRSRRTADPSPAEEEPSVDSENVKDKEGVSEKRLKTPVIRLTRVSRRNVSPKKIEVEVASEEDGKKSETPAAEVKETVTEEVEETITEVKETVRGRRARGGPRTQSPGKAVGKSEDVDTKSRLVDVKAENTQVETVVIDSSRNVEEKDPLKEVKESEESTVKGTKSPRILKRRTLWKSPKPEKREPDVEAKDVTDLKMEEDVVLNEELKVTGTLDIKEESGKETCVAQKVESVEQVSVAEVKVPANVDSEEKMDCDFQEKKELRITDKEIKDMPVVGEVKMEVNEEVPSQSQENLNDAPAKTPKGKRILRRGAGKENSDTRDSKNTADVADEVQSHSTEIVKVTPSRLGKGRKGITEVEGKETKPSQDIKAPIKIEPILQKAEAVESDKTEAKVVVNEVKGEPRKIVVNKKSAVKKALVKEPIEFPICNSSEKMETEDSTEAPPLGKLEGGDITLDGKEEVKVQPKSKMNTVKGAAVQKAATKRVAVQKPAGKSGTIQTPVIKKETVQKPAVKRDAADIEIVEVPSFEVSKKMKVEDLKSPVTAKVKDVILTPGQKKQFINDTNKPAVQDKPNKTKVDDKVNKEAVKYAANKETIEDTANKEVIEDTPNKAAIEDTANKEAIEDMANKETIEDTANKDAVEDTTKAELAEETENKGTVENTTNEEAGDTSDEINFDEFIEVDGVDEKDHSSLIDGDEELDYEDPDENVDDDVSSLDADELLIIEDDAEYRSLFDEEIMAQEEARSQNKQAKGRDQEKKRALQAGKTEEKGKKGDAGKGSVDDKRKKDNGQTRRRSLEPRDRRKRSRSRRKSPESKDRRSPESRSRKSSPDSRSRQKSPESRDKRKSPSDCRDKRKSSPDSKVKRKNADQDKKRDNLGRNDRKRSKSPSKVDSKKDHAAGNKLQIHPKTNVKKGNPFRRVVFLANSLYKSQLKGVENAYVKVIYEDSLSSETLIHIIQKHRKEYGKNTLWMLLAGIYTFIDDERAASCRTCKDPLRIIVKSNQSNTNQNNTAMLEYILKLCRVTCDSVQKRLGSESLITFAPPLPALLAITDNYKNHQKLHEAAEGINLISTKITYEKVRKRYNVFCKEWINRACNRNKSWINVAAFREYRDRGDANLFPVYAKDRFDMRMKKWFETMEKFINLALETPFPSAKILGKLSTTRKSDMREEPPLEEPGTEEKFAKVVVVGNTTFTKELQDLTKHLNVEHLDENIDFDEDGLAFLNELQKKHPSRTLWVVLSGVSEVAEMDESGPPKCKILNCEEPIPVFVTKSDPAGDPEFKDMNIDQMVNVIVKDAFSFATLATNHLKEESGIFLSPIMPLCAIWSGHATAHTHDAIHRMYKRDPNVPHFIGTSSSWIKSAKALEIKWLDKIMGSLKTDSHSYELMKNYREERPPVLQYVEDVTDPKVKQVQKSWSKMMANMLQYYLVGRETKSSVDSSVVQDMDVDSVPPVVSNYQAPLNGVSSGIVPEAYPHGAASVGYTYPEAAVLINPQLSSVGVQPLPVMVAGTPQLTAAYPGVLAYPAAAQGIAYQGFQGATPQDPYLGGWTTLGNATTLVPSNSVAPVSEASATAIGTSTTPAAVKGHLVIQNVDTDMNERQARSLLQEFGEMGEMKWPLNQKDQPARFLMINYKQRKHAERAERILNYLKVFGDNSQVKLIGVDMKEGGSKLESEDLELLLSIHDVLDRIKKESKMNKAKQNPLYHQLSQKKAEPVVAETVAPVIPMLTILVSNFTNIVPVKDINEMFVELGACGQGILIQNALHFTFKGEPAMINLLTGFRFPDKKMEVVVKAAINEPRLTTKALKEAKAKMEEPLAKLMKKIGDVLKEEINNEMNVYTFKTRLCRYADGCKAKDLCPKFHDAADRRRCLILFRYSDEMCTDLEESGSCEAKDKCASAHSPLEILFHFKNFRSSICPGWQQSRACDKVGRVCSYVHPGKPEMLYNEKWDNVYVEGLKMTLDYMAEAVRNLFLVKDLQCLRVLLVTSTPEMAKLYVDCLAELTRSCNQKVSMLVGDAVEDGTTVLITTVDALRPLLNTNKPGQPKKFDASRLKALILDDGPTLLKHCPKYMHNFFADLSRKGANVVVTAEKIVNRDVEDAQAKLHPTGGFKKIFAVSSKKKDSKPPSAKPGSYGNDVLERLISATWSVDPKASENQGSKETEDMSTSMERNSARGSTSRTLSSKDSSSHNQQSDDRIKILAALEIEYKKTLTELEKEQERELELYISSPEFHPEYEQKYSIFMEQYKVQYPERTDMEHSNKLWDEFWKELITLLLQEEYDAKKQSLEKEHKEKKENASKPIPRQDSRNKENKQDEDKQERRPGEAQKRKSSTDDRDGHREKYRRDESSSDVGRGRMNQNRDESGSRGRAQQYNRNEGNDKGKRHQFNRNEEVSRDTYGRGQQYRGPEEKSSRFSSLQQNSNKDEFSQDRRQQFNLSVDKTGKNEMAEAVSLLLELCPSLGVLGPAAQLLLRKISLCGSNKQELCKLVQDEDSQIILTRLSEKALGVSQMYGSGPQAMKLKLASTQALKLLNMASIPLENPKYYGLDIENIAKLTYNMDPSFIVQSIRNALNTKGIINASENDVTDIYVAVTSAHFGIAYNKSGEASQLKSLDNGQRDNRSLKRGRPSWKDEEVSTPKRGEGSWLGKQYGGNSRDFTQGRQSGVGNEYGAFGSGNPYNKGGDVNQWNAKTSDTMNSPLKINYGHQKTGFSQPKVTDYGHQSSKNYSRGLDIASSDMEFNRLANFSSLSGSLNSGAQGRNMTSGDRVSFKINRRGKSNNKRGNQKRDNKPRGNRGGGTFNQRSEQMRGNSSGQQGKDVSLMEFLSQW